MLTKSYHHNISWPQFNCLIWIIFSLTCDNIAQHNLSIIIWKEELIIFVQFKWNIHTYNIKRFNIVFWLSPSIGTKINQTNSILYIYLCFHKPQWCSIKLIYGQQMAGRNSIPNSTYKQIKKWSNRNSVASIYTCIIRLHIPMSTHIMAYPYHI